MTKAEIVADIANKTGIEKVAVQATIEAFMETLKSSMIHGQNVYLRGFGSFIIKKGQRKREGTFPRTPPSSSPLTTFRLLSQRKPSLTR